ncbi:MAG: formylglycine-generating enzyme family protein [Burkholderiales bacterium]
MHPTPRSLCLALGLVAIAAFAGSAAAQDKSSAPGTVFRDCPMCPEMVVIPAGSFTMGSALEESGHMDEKPQHTVNIRAFSASKFEVTFEEWDACVADGRCEPVPDDGVGRKGIPVFNVNHADAQAYAAWLSGKTGRKYRLMSESEWEYAARAGTSTPWFWGAPEDSAGSTKACEFANTHDESGKDAHPMYVWSNHKCADGVGEVGPVGKYKPNPFGLHDILGNLREWVQDCHHAGYKDAPTDGSAWNEAHCEKRIVRGGAWMDGASTSRAAYRHPEDPKYRNYLAGFRIARDL